MIISPPSHKTFFPDTATEFLKRKLPVKSPIIEGLLYHRDMVALGARRRHGKTTFVIDLALTLAEGKGQFLGYDIAGPAKTLLVLIEDDPSELQTRLSKHLGESPEVSDRVSIVTREDFADNGAKVDIADENFQRLLERWAAVQKPDVIVLDNLSFLIAARFNDAEQMHKVAMFLYKLASKYNAALIVCAHPRKDSVDPKTKKKNLTLENETDLWFEQLMGSSHFINAMPSLWGLERDRAQDVTVFVGGRQRVDGSQHVMNITYDNGRLTLVNDYEVNYSRIVNTPKRVAAWNALPARPATFTRSEAEKLITEHLKSASSKHEWLSELKRLKLLVDTEDGKLVKALDGKLKESHEKLAAVFPGDWIEALPEEMKPDKYKDTPSVLPFTPKPTRDEDAA
jgi:hypothetical protein